jgi:IPT/TIG domain/Galactose oxidase, central domain
MTSFIPRELGLLASLALGITGCTPDGSEVSGIDGTGAPRSTPSSAPDIIAISPTDTIAGGTTFDLTVDGANFVTDSTVQFRNQQVTSAFVSSTHLIVTVPAAAIATAGRVEVSVANPGGEASMPVAFTINQPLTAGTNAIGNMITPRARHAAVLLANGKVLIAGGSDGLQALASAELYDPSTRTFAPTGSMATARYRPSAVLLSNGKVLVIGGERSLSAEIYDPATETFIATRSMVSGGINEFSPVPLTLLENGSVFVASLNGQIYDPASGTFFLAAAYPDPSYGWWGTANLLQDGRVLLTGCASGCSRGATALYNPVTSTFSNTGVMRGWLNVNTATLLMNGTVLFVGNDENDSYPANAELYDPAADAFGSLGNAIWPHEFAAAARLPNGTVLITGGQLPGGTGSAGVDLYDPATGNFTAAGNMTARRHSHTATLLTDGTVLIAGGHSSWPASTASAEVYNPSQ